MYESWCGKTVNKAREKNKRETKIFLADVALAPEVPNHGPCQLRSYNNQRLPLVYRFQKSYDCEPRGSQCFLEPIHSSTRMNVPSQF